MKIVLDMNVSPLWADMLASQGHDVCHWRQVGASDAADADIMAWARDNDHVVMTNDLDFGEILAITNGKKPSVIQLRDGRNDPQKMLPVVSQAIANFKDALETGALISIDHLRSRVKVLPLRQEI